MSDSPPGDWYLRDWMRHFGKKQAALVNELGWLKGRASKVWNGKQEYRRDVVNELARWLGIESYELLMPPDLAMSLRRQREIAHSIVAETASEFRGSPEEKPKRTKPKA